MKTFRYLCFLSMMLCPTTLLAEGYVAGQIGALLRSKFTGVEIRGGGLVVSPQPSHDRDLAPSPLLGVKAGYFLPGSLRWLGGEIEYFKTSPDFTASTGDAMHMDMNTFGLNLIARYPGRRLQPYAGVGLGLFWAKIAPGGIGVPGDVSSFSPGLNLLAGLRLFLTQSVATFIEYKYNNTTLEFPGGSGGAGVSDLKGDYRPQHIVIGLGYHF